MRAESDGCVRLIGDVQGEIRQRRHAPALLIDADTEGVRHDHKARAVVEARLDAHVGHQVGHLR